MAKIFYVFWLPRMYHKELLVLDTASHVITDEISDDISPAAIHHIKIEIDSVDTANHDITIDSRLGDDRHVTIVLKYINDSHNGLIQYYYEADNRNHEAKFISEAIPNAIYHLIKSFFHAHEYHHPQGDSTLFAFSSKKEVDIKGQDNEALMHYLEQYEKKFRGYRKSAFEQLQYIEEKNEESADEYYINYLRRHSHLDSLCDKALGESLYYETLLYSWYNGSCKHNREGHHLNSCQNCDTQSESCKRLHRLALNTKNAIDSIRIIKQGNKNLFDYKNSEYTIKALEGIENGNSINQTLINDVQSLLRKGDKVAKNSYFAGIVGVVLGVISVFLGAIALRPSSNSENKPEVKVEKSTVKSSTSIDSIPFTKKDSSSLVVSQQENVETTTSH